MANKIGPVTLENVAGIPNITVNGNIIKIEGFFSSKENQLQLQEMFRKALGNTVLHTLIGGVQIGHDCTEDSVLSQYCEWDFDKLQDGYYMLRNLDITFEQFAVYYPFNMTLFFIGTSALVQQMVSIYTFEELTNDWDI